MKFENYNGTAGQYIREYLDASGALDESPTSDDEARALWTSLEESFADDGGTGISEDEFADAVSEMQERFVTN